jgi:predicted RNase H-like HicB family nuclease
VDGDTEEEALQTGREAAKLHLEALIEGGDPVPFSILEGEEAGASFKNNKKYHLEEVEVN